MLRMQRINMCIGMSKGKEKINRNAGKAAAGLPGS
jgi:hypothetical protein